MVEAGRLTVEVTLVRGGTASGRGPQAEEEPVRGALLEFRSGAERFRRPTDERGRVELGAMRPGEWTVTVVGADLPAFHRFEEDSISVGVAPGESAEIELVARPVERQIEIVATGELREGREGERDEQEDVEVPEDPEVTADPEVTEEPEVAEDPEVSEEPETTEEPEVAADLEVTEEPEVSEDPEEDAPRLQEYESGEVFRVSRPMTLWHVAWLMYRDSSLWPRIWVANRDRAPDPAVVSEEIELRIPPEAPLNEVERRAREEHIQNATASWNEPASFRLPRDMPLWDVAWRVYQDPDLWPKIWVANRDRIPYPSAARVGLQLEIPPAGPLTPAERRAEEEYRGRDGTSLPPRR